MEKEGKKGNREEGKGLEERGDERVRPL